MTNDVTEEKRALRVNAAEARRMAHRADTDGHAGRAAAAHFFAWVTVPAPAVIGGYWPTGTEIDVRPLLVALHERGHVCGLPAVQRGQPLTFHRWRPEDRLVRGVFDIQVPDHHTPTVDPDLLLMPLLAFDAKGMRIGYGGGYYDRTIPAIRARKTLLTVGIAYAAQEVERVPADKFDQRLDWIVTEKAARFIERRRFPWLRKFLSS
ncbi:MAG TPA: 5-formyltetrahydrofolate cyclo-ligase [Alphaproteobacteria bacterium]